MNTGRASNTGRGSDIIVLIEAGGFYSRKYGIYMCSLSDTVLVLNSIKTARTFIAAEKKFKSPHNNKCKTDCTCGYLPWFQES